MKLVEYHDNDTIEMTNLVLSNEEDCKKLLSIYFDTSSDFVINKYYNIYEELQERGHFDPQIRGGGYSWNWAAFCFGPLFFWYRKQYEYMVFIIISMFFFFFPGLILAGFVANMPILNDFTLAVARGMDKVYDTEPDIVRGLEKFEENEDGEGYMNYFYDNVYPFIEEECKKRGGTNEYAYVVPFAVIIGIIYITN